MRTLFLDVILDVLILSDLLIILKLIDVIVLVAQGALFISLLLLSRLLF